MENLGIKNKTTCCQKKEEALNKISIQEAPIIEGLLEWIKWTKSKKVCQECKEFRADTLNAIDKTATKTDKDAYIENTLLPLNKTGLLDYSSINVNS